MPADPRSTKGRKSKIGLAHRGLIDNPEDKDAALRAGAAYGTVGAHAGSSKAEDAVENVRGEFDRWDYMKTAPASNALKVLGRAGPNGPWPDRTDPDAESQLRNVDRLIQAAAEYDTASENAGEPGGIRSSSTGSTGSPGARPPQSGPGEVRAAAA